MFQFFPFSNSHQLNLDWILETISKLPWTVNNTPPDEFHNINLPTVAGMSSWNSIGADGSGNVDPIENIGDLDSPVTGLHFYDSGSGIVISYTDGTDGFQAAFSTSTDSIEYRHIESGSWTAWIDVSSALSGYQDISTDIILNNVFLDNGWSQEKYAVTKSGWCYGRIASRVRTGTQFAKIADGLPLPNIPNGATAAVLGTWTAFGSSNPNLLTAFINTSQELILSGSGGPANNGDTIEILFCYPCT